MSRILDLVGSIHRSEEGHALPAVASTIGGVGAILLGIGAATIREHSQSSAVSLRPSAFSAARCRWSAPTQCAASTGRSEFFLSDGMHARLESALVFASTIASTVN
jgi:hypothetical protein